MTTFREVTADHIQDTLDGPEGTVGRQRATAMRSLFRVLKRERLLFRDLVRHLPMGDLTGIPRPVPSDVLAGLLDQATAPFARFSIALAAMHAVPVAEIRTALTADLLVTQETAPDPDYPAVRRITMRPPPATRSSSRRSSASPNRPPCATSAPPTQSEPRNWPRSGHPPSPMPQRKPVAVWHRVRHHPCVMVMQPVLEIFAADDFALWPVGEQESYGYLVLDGELTPAEVGTAVMRIADCNNFEPEEEQGPRPTDPLGAFLHGLLTMPNLFAAGGFRVTDTATDTVFVEPGCCNGLEAWRDWREVLDGTGCSSFGHDPSSAAERVGDTVRLTLDADAKDGSPVIELPMEQVRALVTGAEADLRAFLSLAGTWAEQHLPTHAAAVTAALARALDLELTE
ncbi:hypothetical protein [Streptomyces caniferus]|uniref:hypothetical protein n=1 Tax=Streptomyces caniferus TaxID=285557 RepID=UPI0037F3E489